MVIQRSTRPVDASESGCLPKVVAAIPAFNEVRTIGSLVLEALWFVDEVVVVDDGSTDDTSEVAALAGATVIRHPRNLGYGGAIASCFRYAQDVAADLLVVLDGDGQHDPSQIPDLLAPIRNGEADVSIGSRFLERNPASDVPAYRKFGISVLTKLTNLGSENGVKVTDGQSGYRAYSARAIRQIHPLEPDMGVSAEILLEAAKHSLQIKEVPIDCSYEVGGSTRGPVQHGLAVFGSIVRYIETEHALLAFGLPGLVAFLLGVGLGANTLYEYVSTDHLAIIPLIASILLIVGGLVVGSTGLILHAVINAARRWRAFAPPEPSRFMPDR